MLQETLAADRQRTSATQQVAAMTDKPAETHVLQWPVPDMVKETSSDLSATGAETLVVDSAPTFPRDFGNPEGSFASTFLGQSADDWVERASTISLDSIHSDYTDLEIAEAELLDCISVSSSAPSEFETKNTPHPSSADFVEFHASAPGTKSILEDDNHQKFQRLGSGLFQFLQKTDLPDLRVHWSRAPPNRTSSCFLDSLRFKSPEQLADLAKSLKHL